MIRESRVSDNYPGISLLGGWVVGLTVDNGSHPIIFNESLVRIQFQNQLYQVGNLDQPTRVTYTVQYLQSMDEGCIGLKAAAMF
jgi:hypothetical protein